MKIKELKINAFGKLKEKEIEFGEHINIVQGNNESGKSTLLKFITNIFYGTSKNKKGREFSDYDKFKPWKSEEFSGKLTYTLDNGKKYEVFRDFNKKNPIIYDEQLEDISKQFNIDKTNGNQFFIEQTNVDENMFLSTLVSMQQEVKLDKSNQNTLIQKVANLAGSGDDNVSYKKAIDKLNKKQLEEIGTSRSQGRPINIVKEEKFELQDEIGELESFKESKLEIEKEKDVLKQQLIEIEENLNIIKKVKEYKDNENIEYEKININKKIIQDQKERIEKLEKEKNSIIEEEKDILDLDSNISENNKDKKQNKVKNNNRIAVGILLLTIILEVLNLIFVKNILATIIIALVIISSMILILIQTKKIKQGNKVYKENKQKEITKRDEIEKKIEQLKAEIKVLKANIDEQEKDINENITKLNLNKSQEIEKLNLIYKNKENYIIELFEINYIQNELNKIEEEKNKKKLEIHSIELEENNIIPKLEKIAQMEEKLQELNEREKQLEKDNNAIETAKEILEIAYQKMKQNVTPKLTQNLSENINKISNGKYKKIMLHEEKGMIIENQTGEYIEIEKLSVGTIEQLYLSLRLAIVDELTDEKMPIILDESFAYYDEERLANILTFINEQYKDRQVIIFTCTNREKEILENKNISFNQINL